jgi:hypothetical protein
MSIFLHMLMYKDIGEFMSLHPCAPDRSEMGFLGLG